MSSHPHRSFYIIASESESHTRTHETKRLARRAYPRPPVFSRVTFMRYARAPAAGHSTHFNPQHWLCVIWIFISSTKTPVLAIIFLVPMTSVSPYLNFHISAESWHMKKTKPYYFIVTSGRFIFRSQKYFCFHLHLQLSWWRHDNVIKALVRITLNALKSALERISRHSKCLRLVL
jgi:hypothetical protein